jgi:Ca2+-binding RTX toxin-like protein
VARIVSAAMKTLARSLAVLAALAAFAWPGEVRAATVSLSRDDLGLRLTYTAAPGEANRLSIAAEAGALIVRDDRARVKPGSSCTAFGVHAARCRPGARSGEATSVLVDLGDRRDVARVSDPRGDLEAAQVLGGAGNDTIDISGVSLVSSPDLSRNPEVDGGPGGDRIIGSRQGDHLAGGAGADRLQGRGGADLLVGDPAGYMGRDRLIGEAGQDTVDYQARTTPVVVDLARGRGGAGGREDVIRSVEDAVGGRDHDVLRGTAGPNSLGGWGLLPQVQRDVPGDTLVGRGGDDLLVDFVGESRLEGGPGDDSIVGSRLGDTLACGAGTDSLTRSVGLGEFGDDAGQGLDTGVLVPVDCDVLAAGQYFFRSGAVLGNRLVWSALAAARHGGVILTVRDVQGAVLGRTAFTGTTRVSVRLNALGRRAARQHAVVGVYAHQPGLERIVAWHVRL